MSDNNLRFIIKQLENPQLLSIVIPVLYNISSDFGTYDIQQAKPVCLTREEPAQRLALADGLYLRLIEIVESGMLASSPSFSYLCRLLDLSEGKC